MDKKHFHFIAIGGAAMHNLALALAAAGHVVTGSDDEINEPSRSRLLGAGLLPEHTGWFPEKINQGIHAIILGMHARNDNPELMEAQRLGVPVFSYPEFLYNQSLNKLRVVIGGSHGKTTITAMILHVLRYCGKEFDYMVGAKLAGFETMVKLSDAPVIVLEGDEYLSSPVDRRPKFHLYQAQIAVISGISWDHINVFPTFENYVEQFRIFAGRLPADGKLIYCREDVTVAEVARSSATQAMKIPYGVPQHRIENGVTYIMHDGHETQVKVFGKHNLMNMEAARLVCEQLAVSNADFFRAISSFEGASRRLELLEQNGTTAVYKDFAHSPSKLKATIDAVKDQFPERKLIACMELHTFSSLNEAFLKEYRGAMEKADIAMVYFNPHTIAHKKLSPVSSYQVSEAFAKKDLMVFTDSGLMKLELLEMNFEQSVVLLMSSGNFDGLSLEAIALEIIQKSLTLTSNK
mgnify:CR=1 FL=1